MTDEPRVKGAITCPNCGHRGPIDKDFGTRRMKDELWLQSWCRACRSKREHKKSLEDTKQ